MVDKGRKQVTPPQDNYAEFRGKIDAAREQLQKRSTSLENARSLVEYMHNKHLEAVSSWEDRVIDLTIVMEDYSGGAEGYETLANLLETAQKMDASFRRRSARVQTRLDEITSTNTSVANALIELDEAKDKLEMSRHESEARENLDRVTSSLSASEMRSSDPDRALHGEIAQARLAIASAEALVEIKEPRRG